MFNKAQVKMKIPVQKVNGARSIKRTGIGIQRHMLTNGFITIVGA